MATAIDADLLVLLTDVDGVFNRNPSVDPTATRLSHMEVEKFVDISTEGGSSHGTGGMSSKVDAAAWACKHGVTTLIANGYEPAQLHLPAHASAYRCLHTPVRLPVAPVLAAPMAAVHGCLLVRGSVCQSIARYIAEGYGWRECRHAHTSEQSPA